MMKALGELSAYIGQSVHEGHSIWIAQKEGRAKDGDDKTDPAILKMFYAVSYTHLDQDGKLSLQVELPVGSQNIKVTVVAGSQEFDMNGQPISGEVKFRCV